MSSRVRLTPPDQAQRERALAPARSVIVQAPAGSGKTDLLTRRFLRLLAEVDDPAHIVAITFTKAAAAEMRHRILSELEKAAARPSIQDVDDSSMEALAAKAREHASRMGWNLLEIPGQLRISTIDSFCREIAMQRPLLTTLGGSLDVSEEPEELYRRAARNTLMQLGRGDSRRGPSAVSGAIEALLLWRDNNWHELESHLITMLGQRDRWMQEFWLRDFDDHHEAGWDRLREHLERPFARAVAEHLSEVTRLLSSIPGACEESHALAQFAHSQIGGALYRDLAELAEFPLGPLETPEELEGARQVYNCLAQLLLTNDGAFRQKVDKRHGFPADRTREKSRLQQLTRALTTVDGLQSALATIRALPPARYPDEDWRIIRAAFAILRHAAGELQVEFAQSGSVDFIEVSQVAQRILQGEDGLPSDAAIDIADGIRHLLVDEFQDTSRRQHRLIASLVAAWPDASNRSLFVVGDPMQSIYFFRDADAELFPRVQQAGLELPERDPLALDVVRLESNFRTQQELVRQLNDAFEAIFGINDGNNVRFNASQPARSQSAKAELGIDVHLRFIPQIPRTSSNDPDAALAKDQAAADREASLEEQTAEIVTLIRSRLDLMEQARIRGEKYRIAVLGRTRAALAPIAQALRDAAIPFRAIDLEPLADRPEILDALALARALLNIEDRVAWLGLLRAPWCALSLADLHTLTSDDDPGIQARPIPDVMRERKSLLSNDARIAVERALQAYTDSVALRSAMPEMSSGAWLQQIWLRLGGDFCVDAKARANLDLLWRCLDNLPGGDADLTGPALEAALAKLMAQPDPGAEGDCGVHLMTIHKSKGLEFEVVIVPELQAACANTRSTMFSWLERGLESSHASGEITEFLIAPFQTKGADRGKAKEWVDREYRAKESQETRRILYVAATRAREELHLFARPSWKLDQGEPALCEPAESLLSKAWPALENRARAEFDAWKAQRQSGEIVSLAAGADNVIAMPAPPTPALLRRLPSDFKAPQPFHFGGVKAIDFAAPESPIAYQRHEGGIDSRALGSGVHLALQLLAQLRSTLDWAAARAQLAASSHRIAAQIRATGMDRERASVIVARAVDLATRVSLDPIGAWILSPHENAQSEVRWTGVVAGAVRTVQADRVFRAGHDPLSKGSDAWWIIDYKTAQHRENLVEALPKLRELFAPQLELYASVLRKLHGPDSAIRAGLFYPRLLQLDWWEV